MAITHSRSSTESIKALIRHHHHRQPSNIALAPQQLVRFYKLVGPEEQSLRNYRVEEGYVVPQLQTSPPPELCRGPLDHRGLLNCCGYCGHKHLIDDCAQLKMLDQLSQGIWKQYIIYYSRRGLAPFATRGSYDKSNFHGGPHREVLSPEMARRWEKQVMAYDAAAGRSLYWRRFKWNQDTLKPTTELYDRLPSDPTIPQYLRNTGPPRNVAPKTPGFAGCSHMSAGYLNTWHCREDELVYDPYWLLFESGPRIPPDTDHSINEAQVRLNWMTGQPVGSFQTRLDWPEPMDIDI
ncbi:hypothetical protein PG989_002396 [Apiospora arundinis]